MMQKQRLESCERNILNKYIVKISPQAYREIAGIYQYIAENLMAPASSLRVVTEIESAIFSLDILPYCGAERKIGRYADKGYRQLFVENYTIVYRIDEMNKQVIIVTIQYSPGNF